jgi:hypothetical protein
MAASLGSFISASTRTPLRIVLSSLTGTVVFGLFDFNVSRSVVEAGFSPELTAALQAAIVGLAAGAALWLLLSAVAQRRRHLADELNRVAELNHTIRNSLEIIVLAHYASVDPQHRDLILDCTRRIDAKLKELFPAPGSELNPLP